MLSQALNDSYLKSFCIFKLFILQYISMTENKNIHPRIRNRRVHLANERTFLLWIRTSIGIMAFGFVVEKFGLFLRQLYLLTGRQFSPNHREYSSFFGIF